MYKYIKMCGEEGRGEMVSSNSPINNATEVEHQLETYKREGEDKEKDEGNIETIIEREMNGVSDFFVEQSTKALERARVCSSLSISLTLF